MSIEYQHVLHIIICNVTERENDMHDKQNQQPI